MNTKIPTISIIVPCYNVGPFLSACLDSILSQKHNDIEIICINDGSTDITPQILKEYKLKDQRLHVIPQRNAGLSAARNAGISHAKGNWLMFVDADDWLEENCLELVLKCHREDLLCFSYNRVFESNIKPRKLNLNGKYTAEFIQRRIVGLVGEELQDPTQADSLVTAWGKVYDSTIIMLHHIRFTDTALIGTEDALFNIEYLQFANSVLVLDQPLYNYRKSSGSSLTQTHKSDLFAKWKNLYKRIGVIIKDKDPIFKRALQNRICLSVIGLGLNETFGNSSLLKKKAKIHKILSDDLYVGAFQNFKLKFLPLHWKVFFFLAKYRQVLPLLGMLQFIKNRIR